MKRIITSVVLLILLVSCNHNQYGSDSSQYGSNNRRCYYSICLVYKINGPIEALKSTLITISFLSEIDYDEVSFIITIPPNIQLNNIEPHNFDTKATYIEKDGQYIWSMSLKAEEEYIVSAYFTLSQPSSIRPVSFYDFYFGIAVPNMNPDFGLLALSPDFYLGPDGKAMTRIEAQNKGNVLIPITMVPGGFIAEGTFQSLPPTTTPTPKKTSTLISDVLTKTPTSTVTITPSITITATITSTWHSYPVP